ncbi:MAG TPA: TIGR02921 family PEP-CTERM protein [Oscillatoriaceae cyanobacterium M33_DOE_052]|nr:TIGR02921 family PEP-CTERM protein [Oscillatoriaceae cyanobacterium M33_DOE_052]
MNLGFLIAATLGMLPAAFSWGNNNDLFYTSLVLFTLSSSICTGCYLWLSRQTTRKIPSQLGAMPDIFLVGNLTFYGLNLAIKFSPITVDSPTINLYLSLIGVFITAVGVLALWGWRRWQNKINPNNLVRENPLGAAAIHGFLFAINATIWKMALSPDIFSQEGSIEWIIISLILIATVMIVSCLGWQMRHQPVKLWQLMMGVEGPVFLLSLLWLVLWFDPNLPSITTLLDNRGVALILGSIIICIIAFPLELYQGYLQRYPMLASLQMIFHSIMPGIGVYWGLFLLFYTVPVAIFIGPQFLLMTWVESFLQMWMWQPWWMSVLAVIFWISALFFLFLPWGIAQSYIKSSQRVFTAFSRQYGRPMTTAISLVVLTAWMTLALASRQPQIEAFNLLSTPANTDSAKQELIAKSEKIRQGLLAAYLHPYRYLFAGQDDRHIRDIYTSIPFLPENTGEFLQGFYNHLIAPFLYGGSRDDIKTSARLYAEFFDTPIQKAERKEIQRVLEATGNLDDAKAGVLNIDQKKVWLREQQVTVQPHGDWADVELYEFYQNKTNNVEEVLYYFNLPESAVLTGVWLGDNNNREKRFPFKVSTRGAAQRVYNSQVQRERPIDPALLEQVGPRQYRLRAFPVPVPLSSWEREQGVERPTEMHLWLTYKVMRQEKGWPMPKLAEKRNIFWNRETVRLQNGAEIKFPQDDWLPEFIPAAGEFKPELHQVNLAGGDRVTAKPLAIDNYALPQGKRLALVVDGSRSMGTHRQELKTSFKWVQEVFATRSDVDIYFTAATVSQPQRWDEMGQFNADKVTFYGTLQLQDMLSQFEKLRGNTAYDGIVLVTDDGSYELADDHKDLPKLAAPLWLVHLGGMPKAYDDGILSVIAASDGGVAADIAEALQRMAAEGDLDDNVVNVVDGYAWVVEKAAGENLADAGFAPLAARQLIESLRPEEDGEKIGKLDAVNAIAQKYAIVTPYSSMIVLVNDAQREALKRAEAQANRFDRAVEDGEELLDQINGVGVSVPEPGLIIGLGAITFIGIMRRRRYKGS